MGDAIREHHFFMKLASDNPELGLAALLSVRRACNPAFRFLARFLLTALAVDLVIGASGALDLSGFEGLARWGFTCPTTGGGGSWIVVFLAHRPHEIVFDIPIRSIFPSTAGFLISLAG